MRAVVQDSQKRSGCCAQLQRRDAQCGYAAFRFSACDPGVARIKAEGGRASWGHHHHRPYMTLVVT